MTMHLIPQGNDGYVVTQLPISAELAEMLRNYPEEEWPWLTNLALTAGMAVVSRLNLHNRDQEASRRQQLAAWVQEAQRRGRGNEADLRQYLESGLHEMLAGWEERVVKDFRDAIDSLDRTK